MNVRVKAVAEDLEHRSILRQNLGDELRDPTRLGDLGEPLDQNRAQAVPLEAVGHLDGDFCAFAVDLDEGRVADEQPCPDRARPSRSGPRHSSTPTARRCRG